MRPIESLLRLASHIRTSISIPQFNPDKWYTISDLLAPGTTPDLAKSEQILLSLINTFYGGVVTVPNSEGQEVTIANKDIAKKWLIEAVEAYMPSYSRVAAELQPPSPKQIKEVILATLKDLEFEDRIYTLPELAIILYNVGLVRWCPSKLIRRWESPQRKDDIRSLVMYDDEELAEITAATRELTKELYGKEIDWATKKKEAIGDDDALESLNKLFTKYVFRPQFNALKAIRKNLSTIQLTLQNKLKEAPTTDNLMVETSQNNMDLLELEVKLEDLQELSGLDFGLGGATRGKRKGWKIKGLWLNNPKVKKLVFAGINFNYGPQKTKEYLFDPVKGEEIAVEELLIDRSPEMGTKEVIHDITEELRAANLFDTLSTLKTYVDFYVSSADEAKMPLLPQVQDAKDFMGNLVITPDGRVEVKMAANQLPDFLRNLAAKITYYKKRFGIN